MKSLAWLVQFLEKCTATQTNKSEWGANKISWQKKSRENGGKKEKPKLSEKINIGFEVTSVADPSIDCTIRTDSIWSIRYFFNLYLTSYHIPFNKFLSCCFTPLFGSFSLSPLLCILVFSARTSIINNSPIWQKNKKKLIFSNRPRTLFSKSSKDVNVWQKLRSTTFIHQRQICTYVYIYLVFLLFLGGGLW